MAAVRTGLTALYILAVLILGAIGLWSRVSTRFEPAKIQAGAVNPAATASSTSNSNPSGANPAGVNPASASPISLNTATQGELERLPGVGPALAERIIQGRPYSGLEDLDRVKGVGPRMIEKLKGLAIP